ncbi:methyl-accepting chemotaxis protein [Halobacteria archaeon AArc-curdl1]|uniref:Methyl-accepting chemotaxis protein n=1 Tax=Natronosalvus hydrolyticus TaxID=2979988 RepID=A0AAP2Z7J0_9EURY|nr:methyl-accepting chemotaxis protein [Halobacteria archaeon AArc-curdl1]
MPLETAIPATIRRRYSYKIITALLGVLATTVAICVLFTAHVLATGDGSTVSTGSVVSGFTGITIVFFLHLGLVTIVLGGNVSLALSQLAERAERIGDGDLEVDLETDRIDEIGLLYGSFETMRNSLAVTLDDLETERERALTAKQETQRQNRALNDAANRYSETMAACADGDLSQRLEPEIDNEAMVAIADSFNEMVADLEETVAQVIRFARIVDETSGDVQAGASEIRRASREVSESIQEISNGSEKQTEDLEVAADEVNDLSATVEEIASTTGSIAEQSAQLSSLATKGREAAATASSEMTDAEARTARVVETIDQLNEDAAQIEAVIELIDEIAEQTNLLALNANIEASRSAGDGDDTEGFSVVAKEVKSLSEETQAAVDDIEETLESIRERAALSAEEIEAVDASVSTTAETVSALNTQLESIVDGVTVVDDGINEINNATASQATSAQELATIVDEVASVSAETTSQAQQVAAAAEESTATIESVSTEVETLDKRADQLVDAVRVFDVSQQAVRADGGWDDA